MASLSGIVCLPNYNVEYNDGGDHTTLCVVMDGQRQSHDEDENNSQTIRDLSQENLPGGKPLSCLNSVGAILRQATSSLGMREAMVSICIKEML